VVLSKYPASTIIAEAGMSRNYFYKRIRGENPFNTNDIDRLCQILGEDPVDIVQRASRLTAIGSRPTRPPVRKPMDPEEHIDWNQAAAYRDNEPNLDDHTA